METELRLVITKGYIKLGTRTIKDGKVVAEHPGGFVEDWKSGQLWVVIDLEKNEVVDGSFNVNETIKKALEYAKETTQ